MKTQSSYTPFQISKLQIFNGIFAGIIQYYTIYNITCPVKEEIINTLI